MLCFHRLRGRCLSTIRDQERLVIVGSGWGGFEFLRRLPRSQSVYEITVISPRNYFVFTPLLASTCVGTLEYRAIIESVKATHPRIRFVQATADDVDFETRKVICTVRGSASRHLLNYDKLIIACGAVTNTFGVPGVDTHALFLKDVEDARRIRRRVIDCFDRAAEDRDFARLHFAIVGGGPTGVEFAAELHDLISQDLCRHYPDIYRHARITMYDIAPRILGGFDARLAAYAMQKFHREGIDVRIGVGVQWVNADEIGLTDGESARVGMTVWVTGIAANPLVRSLRCDKTKSRLLVDDRLHLLRDGRVIGGVYALGDCASIVDHDLPCTAQVAKQQAQYLSKVFKTGSREAVAAFAYKYYGSMAYIGDWRAIVDLRFAHRGTLQRGGRLAWLFWRSAYFSMAVSVKNKVLIPFYWLLTWLFGRDICKI